MFYSQGKQITNFAFPMGDLFDHGKDRINISKFQPETISIRFGKDTLLIAFHRPGDAAPGTDRIYPEVICEAISFSDRLDITDTQVLSHQTNRLIFRTLNLG